MTHITPLTWSQLCTAIHQGPTYHASVWTDTGTDEGTAVSTNVGWIFTSVDGATARIVDPAYLVMHREVGRQRREEA
jgi:hypothetical protein